MDDAWCVLIEKSENGRVLTKVFKFPGDVPETQELRGAVQSFYEMQWSWAVGELATELDDQLELLFASLSVVGLCPGSPFAAGKNDVPR